MKSSLLLSHLVLKRDLAQKESRVNSRERIRLTLNHREPDRVPIHDSVWKSTIIRWRKEGLPANVSISNYFGYEIVSFWVDLSPQFPIEILEEDEEYIIERNSSGETIRIHKDLSSTPGVIDSPVKEKKDWFAIKERFRASESRRVDVGSIKRASDIEEIIHSENYQLNLKQALSIFYQEHNKGKFIVFAGEMGYDRAQHYLGSERLLMAIASDPDWVKDIYITEACLIIDMCDLMIEKGFRFDGAFLASDLGYRNATLFSPECYRDQLFPVDKLVCDYFKSKDMPVILHSDGNIKKLIPYFIEAGFSCIQPLEVKAGMDVRYLKREYGDKLSFMGGIDVRAMANPDPKVIEEEIRSKFKVAKKGGGYIYHCDHSVPHNVSFQQYCKVMELVRKYGRYERE